MALVIDLSDEDIYSPRFDLKEKMNDWRNYVPEEYKIHWNELTPRERKIIIDVAQAAADRENWDY